MAPARRTSDKPAWKAGLLFYPLICSFCSVAFGYGILKTELKETRKDVSEVKEHVKIDEPITYQLTSDIKNIKEDISEIKTDLKEIKDKLDSLIGGGGRSRPTP